MQKLKSLFISAWMFTVFAGVARATYEIMLQQANSEWWFVIVALGSVAFFFTWLFVSGVARTQKFSLAILCINLAAATGMIATGQSNTEAFVWVLLTGLIGSALYEWWYSSFGLRDSTMLRVGATLPDLEFQQADGNIFKTAESARTLLLLFFRGNWCPLCMAQIKEISGLYRELDTLGVEVCLISPQPQGHTTELAKRFDVPMTFLTDPQGRMGDLLGITAKNGVPAGLEALGYDGDTVMPTVLIVDRTKKIVYSDLTSNYRIRPEPDEFLRVLKEAGI